MLNVHLRINDSHSGQPTPVRIRIADFEGCDYAPLGRPSDFPTGRNEAVGGHLSVAGERWYYIDGACEIALPAGKPLRVQARKGPQFRPLDEVVTLGAGQMALRFSIVRVLDSRATKFHSGDLRCHFLAPHAGLLEAMAEDLDFASALAKPTSMLSADDKAYTVVPDLAAFSGQRPALASPTAGFTVNTLNAHPTLGSVGLLHSHRPIFPLTFGGIESDDWSICDWCDQCHRKGGLTVWVDAFAGESGDLGGEVLIAAILGKIDAIEIATSTIPLVAIPWIYRLWNAGVMLPLVGSSGKDGNSIALGQMRTYAYVPGEVNLQAWIDAMRSGQTFASSGPIVDFQVNGVRPGQSVDSEGLVKLAAKAQSLEPFEKLQIAVDGGTISSSDPEFIEEQGIWRAELHMELARTQSFWAACRTLGRDSFAHTSAVRVRIEGQPLPHHPQAAAELRTCLQKTRQWAEQVGRYSNAKGREQLIRRCEECTAKL